MMRAGKGFILLFRWGGYRPTALPTALLNGFISKIIIHKGHLQESEYLEDVQDILIGI